MSTSEIYPATRMLELDTSNMCNLRCLTCIRSGETYIQEAPVFLTLDQFKIILSRFPGLARLQICGFSEPTLNRDTPKMIRHAKDLGVPWVEMFTNGTILRGNVAAQLADSGLNELRTSIDGGNPETYQQVRGVPLLPVATNIREFTLMSEIPVRVECTLSKHTLASVAGMPQVAEMVGARSLAVRLLDGQDSHVTANAVWNQQHLRDLKDKLAVGCENRGIQLIMNLPGEVGFQSRCLAWEEVFVDYRGNLISCYLIRTRVAGNLLTESYEQIVERNFLSMARERESTNGFWPECCCTFALLAQGKTQ